MEIRNLKFNYEPGSPVLLEHLDLSVPPGVFLTILGENGSAKSTLIRLMLGLLKPVEGEVVCDFKTVGYVPQKKDRFNMRFPITLRELMRIHMHRRSKDEPEKYLKMVQMEDFSESLFGDLSGGQQQRVLIARAISASPNLIILDEPLTGIDATSQEVIRDLLLELNSKGMTIISIEHDIAFALHHSSHIITLKDREAVMYTVDDYRHKLKHEDVDNYLYHREEHHAHL